MMRLSHLHGVDSLLRRAHSSGIILSGLNAGSICWFLSGHSDSLKITHGEFSRIIFVDGFGFIPYLHCPHYDEDDRRDFDAMLVGKKEPAVALENLTALVKLDSGYRVIKADSRKKAYVFRVTDGIHVKEELPEGEVEL